MATEIYINDTLVDITEQISIPLNKEIADIRTPEARSTSFTKTVTIAGTKNNDKLFTFIFDVGLGIQNTSATVNYFPDFNPNLKASCTIYVDGILQVRGFVRLLQVNILRENKIEYEVAIYGELGNLFGSIGSKTLGVLDLSRFNHTWNAITIANSWSTSINDSLAPSGTVAFAYGNGYVYPEIDYGYTNNPNVLLSEYYRPAVFVKTIVDKIFSDAGYTYTSDSFFNTATFKRLIIPYTGTGFVLSDAEIAARYLDFSGSDNAVIGTNLIAPATTAGTMGTYNTGTGQLTVSKAGYYEFNGRFQLTNSTVPILTNPTLFGYTFSLKKNGVTVYTVYYTWYYPSTPAINNYNSGELFLAVGDVLEWVFTSVADLTNTITYTGTYNSDIDMLWAVNATRTIPIDEPVDMNTILPSAILQRDFMISLTKMLHLYWDGTDLLNEVKVKSREAYLTNNVLVWTDKLDISNKVNILPMGALDANPYYFTYTPDTDYYNKLYSDEFNRNYGDYKYYINNDFITTEKKIDVIFSPTVLANEPAWNTDRVLSSIKNYDDKGVLSPKSGNIRILYYDLKACNGYTIDGVTTPYYEYPYAGHLDDPYNSTFDLNFGVPLKLYYGATGGGTISYTANNLFHVYYQQYLSDITDKDSKIVRAYFRLRPFDVEKIDFSYLFYFMGQYFRLNRMIDHQLGMETVTQCEFIKAPLAQTEAITTGIGYMIIENDFIIG